MPYKPNPEARGVSHKTDREGFAVNETVDYGAFTTHVFGLACDGAPYSIGELDLNTLTPTFTQGRR